MMRQWLLRLQPVFLLTALVFVVLFLANQWPELRAVQWRLQPGWLLASAALMLASWGLEIALWRHLLFLVGGRMAYGAALRVWFVSALMRYIPGNIWQPLSMTVYCRQRGVRPESTLASLALFHGISLLAAAPFAAIYFPLTGNVGLLTTLVGDLAPWLAIPAALPVVLFLVRPQWLMEILNWALFKMGRPPLPTRLGSRQLLALLLVAMVTWILWGSTFATLFFALGDYGRADIAELAFHLIAVYPLAYAVGFVSLLTPSGFGVREAAFYLLLAPVMDGAVITVAALAMRIWNMLGELVMAGVSIAVEPTLLHRDRGAVQADPAQADRTQPDSMQPDSMQTDSAPVSSRLGQEQVDV